MIGLLRSDQDLIASAGIALMLALSAGGAFAADQPVSVGRRCADPDGGCAQEWLSITARVDAITVTGLRANRGNCPLVKWSADRLPAALKFGQVVAVLFPCHVIEIDVETQQPGEFHQGHSRFSWPD